MSHCIHLYILFKKKYTVEVYPGQGDKNKNKTRTLTKLNDARKKKSYLGKIF